ncbi:regulator of G-protein signaling loco isoform X1 [Toxorhynchites rutilus septentrionalis]|uniref:regulator of G-protein signaling loco isoform X1 n=1 Tax=Toxorhynchites rutilus septentrionalis TaxID=329112 RepID=UPI00247957C3|nr:regulator of G-protein signaling loco isoform X1 [Toxorhynchites rutilus septentrionalis]
MHGHRRRKKRPNYGIRMVEVNRGMNGFGFTISGQQPCILSCIVNNSPADLAGLRAGDFLISVNGMNVSKWPHEAVVQLIGNTYGAIKMAIAENYYSDSSDEDILFQGSQQRARPKYPHYKTKMNRAAAVGKQSNVGGNVPVEDLVGTCEEGTAIGENESPTAYNVIHSPNANNSCDISNVSAMVRSVNFTQSHDEPQAGTSHTHQDQEISLEYKAIVGYLGTIEMPKQIATSSKLQTVRSCIRKMRQEKRNPTTVLMTILPSCLNLINTSNAVIAKYSAVRLNYVSSSSESDNRYFGLVTSAIYADGLMCENSDILNQRKDVIISNSCHVFAIDSKLVEHSVHLDKADIFKIMCTKDPISNLCLEFPCSSEYIVNLIRSMYNLKAPIKPECTSYGKPPVARSLNLEQAMRVCHRGLNDPRLNSRAMDDPHDLLISNSPQPSNHSEITTTSSNSDSGIGFHNDCRNIADRILVVDFPGIPNQISNVRAHFRKSHPFGPTSCRPVGIINEIPPKLDPIRNIRSTSGPHIFHGKSKSADYNIPSTSGLDRLTVRARPDPKSFVSDRSPSKDNALNSINDAQCSMKNEQAYSDLPQLDSWTIGKVVDDLGNVVQERPVDVPKLEESFLDLERYNSENVKNTLLVARSCDDMIMSIEKESCESKIQLSVDDISLMMKKSSASGQEEHVFLQPSKPVKRSKKACSHKISKQNCAADDISVGSNRSSQNGGDKLMSYKLSPKVFGLARPISMSFENISTSMNDIDTGKASKDDKDEHSGEKRSRSSRRLSGGFSAIWGSLQELRMGPKHEDSAVLVEQIEKDTKKKERRLSSFKMLEGTYSEPDLRYDESKPINQNASPFRRWGQSSLRSRSGEQRTPGSSHRRPSSLAASESDVYTKSIDDDYSSTKSGYNPYNTEAVGAVAANAPQTCATSSSASGVAQPGVVSWGTSFEKLLEDTAGLHTFSEFLKKEFSAENIYFWTACERYRQLADREERAKEAQTIFAKHLDSGCSEPVNVDSIARNIAQENLPQAEQTLFAAAQKQIFNLMKFDSYQRFIKSDMYRTCLDAETKALPLPYPGEQLDPMLRTNYAIQPPTKLKKSLSNAEDRRRKSLLPWHRKTRCKSKDRADAESKKESGKSSLSNGAGTGSSSNTLKVLSTNSTSDIHSSRSSLASFDAAIGGKAYDQDDTRNTLCRVILSNGATTVVQTRANETIKELVERLLEKRGIVYNAYEAFLAGNHKPLDLDGPSSSLTGREVNIDQRVVFKLSLPNRKMISVKSKATKPLGDVLRPILLKYNYELDQMNVYSKDVYLDMTYPVTCVDGLWLQVRNGNENDFHQDLARTIASRSERAYANQPPSLPIIATSQHQQIINHFQQQLHYQQSQTQPNSLMLSSTNGNVPLNSKNIAKMQPIPYGGHPHNNHNNNNHLKSKEESKDEAKQELNMLDEITNKVFNELMNGKIVNGKVPEDCTSDSSSTRRDRFRRRGSNAPSESGRGAKSKKCSTAGSEDGSESVNNVGMKKPIIAKLKAGVKLQIPTRSQNDELLEGLKRAQRSRLEDQRGTEINFELPDFLKDKENFTSASNGNSATGSSSTGGAMQPSKLNRKPCKRPDYITSSSVDFPLEVATNGGSLQQINKPQPAPRLSIAASRGVTAGDRDSVASPGGLVHSVSSENNLNNLSMRCNTSLDENVNGSQSENSYADNTLVFTHTSADPSISSESSSLSRSIHRELPSYQLSIASSLGHNYEQSQPTIANLHSNNMSCSELLDSELPASNNYHHHSYHHHHHHHHPQLHSSSAHHHQSHHHHPSANISSGSSTSSSTTSDADNQKGPPPLPPKPKILPMKPSNWGHSTANTSGGSSSNTMSTSLCNLSTSSSGNEVNTSSLNGVSGSNSNSKERRLPEQVAEVSEQHQQQPQQRTRSVYLDHASSSFV